MQGSFAPVRALFSPFDGSKDLKIFSNTFSSQRFGRSDVTGGGGGGGGGGLI